MANKNDLNIHKFNGSGYTEALLELVTGMTSNNHDSLATTLAIENFNNKNINSIGEENQIIYKSGGTLTGTSNLIYDGNLKVNPGSIISTSSGSRTVTQDFGRYYSDSQVLRAGEGHFENIKIQHNFGINSGNTYFVAMDSDSTDVLRLGIGLGDVSGLVKFPRDAQITKTTTSTSSTTGALVVAGGVGIGGNLNVEGGLVVNSNVAIGGNLNVGGLFGLKSGTTIYNISTDSGFTSADDDSVSTSLAIKDYINYNNNVNKFLTEIVTGSTTLERENDKIVKQKTNSGITTTIWTNEEEGDNLSIINRTGFNTTISGSTIEGSSTFTLNNGESISLIYIDSEWLIY